MSIQGDAQVLINLHQRIADLNRQINCIEQAYEMAQDAFVANYGPRYGSDGQLIAGSLRLVVGNRLIEFHPALFEDDDFRIRVSDVEIIEGDWAALPAPPANSQRKEALEWSSQSP